MNGFPLWKRALVAALVVGLCVSGAWFYRTQERRQREHVETDLAAIGQMKANQITAWRSERLGDAGVLTDSPFLSDAVVRCLGDDADDLARAELSARFQSLRERYGYEDVFLVSPEGLVLFAFLPEIHGRVADAAYRSVIEALTTREPVLTELHAGGVHDVPHVSAVAPIFHEVDGVSEPVAAVVLVSNARGTLYPIVQSWPMPTRTAETFLVRRERNEVVFLNDTRRNPNAALNLRFSLRETDLPAVAAVTGQEGVIRGTDYSGAEVLAVSNPIPGSSWHMISKMDVTEAYASWRFRSVVILATTVGLLVLLFTVVLLVGQAERRRYYQELHESDTALHESEKLWRSYVERAPYAVLVVNEKGDFVDVNPAATRVTGYEEWELMTMGMPDLFPTSEGGRRRWQFDRLVREGESYGEYEFINKSGEMRWWSVAAVRLSEYRYLAFGEDITERRCADEEKDKLRSQLAQAQKMESIGRLAGGVAHDFNNMLQVIMGNAELALCREDLDDPVRTDLEGIQNAAHNSADLVRQLLAFARRQTVAPEVLDLDETVSGMLKMLKRLMGEDIELTWTPGSDTWRVKLDPTQVDQLLANLCVNSRDAIDGTGSIRISTENVAIGGAVGSSQPGTRPGEFVVLSVEDNGCGMDARTLKDIFDPFFTTKQVGQGTGLGLATVYGIVKQNHGFIDVDSTPGEGTTFKIYLPRHDGALTEAAAAPGSELCRGSGETVLLVEDEPDILNLCAAVLEELGYSVLSAESPGAALSIAEAQLAPVNLLVTDVVMPEMNGRELAEELESRFPVMKTLYMSGYTADVIAERGILEEGVNFIQKPFAVDRMASKVREVLDLN